MSKKSLYNNSFYTFKCVSHQPPELFLINGNRDVIENVSVIKINTEEVDGKPLWRVFIMKPGVYLFRNVHPFKMKKGDRRFDGVTNGIVLFEPGPPGKRKPVVLNI